MNVRDFKIWFQGFADAYSLGEDKFTFEMFEGLREKVESLEEAPVDPVMPVAPFQPWRPEDLYVGTGPNWWGGVSTTTDNTNAEQILKEGNQTQPATGEDTPCCGENRSQGWTDKGFNMTQPPEK